MSLLLTKPVARGSTWKWWVCVLLLLATMINYMDRLTINLTAKRIQEELVLSNLEYGLVEGAFGIAFACGSLVLGWMADRWNVRWIYPATLFVWSAAGAATGFAGGLAGLMAARAVLGFAEAGNWPCGLRTTQRILPPKDRPLGNGLLQSGTALGSILVPGVVAFFVSGPGTWRLPFFFVGAVGMAWVFLWLGSVRAADLTPAPRGSEAVAVPGQVEERPRSVWAVYADPRFVVLIVITVSINQTWHFLRVWLPKCLQEQYHYPEGEVLGFTTAYYVAAGVGSLVSGAVALRLARGRLGVHGSRVVTFAGFTLLTLLTLGAFWLPAGPVLLALLLLVGFAALGLYPVYYSLSQELTVRHQGKVNGLLGCTTWCASALMHPLVGGWLDRTNDYRTALALAGILPVAGLVALVLLWRPPAEPLAA
jgi:ACS family hexuronate transporter-like MFS transporter